MSQPLTGDKVYLEAPKLLSICFFSTDTVPLRSESGLDITSNEQSHSNRTSSLVFSVSSVIDETQSSLKLPQQSIYPLGPCISTASHVPSPHSDLGLSLRFADPGILASDLAEFGIVFELLIGRGELGLGLSFEIPKVSLSRTCPRVVRCMSTGWTASTEPLDRPLSRGCACRSFITTARFP